MNKLIKTTAIILLGVLSIQLNAQDQKTLFTQWGNTKLAKYKVLGDKGSVDFSKDQLPKYGSNSISIINQDDKYMWAVRFTEHFSSKDRNSDFYIKPDQQAHPTFLMRGSVVLDKLKYHRSFESYGSKKNRLLIVGDYMYELKHLSKAKRWKIENLYLNRKVKLMEHFKLVKKLKAMDHYKLVEDYLAKEAKVLAQKTPAFKKNNAEYYSALAGEDSKVNDRIKESRKILYEQRVGKVVRVVNQTGGTIWVGTKGGAAHKVKNGDTYRFECNLADIYRYGVNGDKSNAKFLFKPKNKCGKKYVIN